MLTVTEEAVAFLLLAEGEEARYWRVRDFGRPGDPLLRVWREVPGVPVPADATRYTFRDRLEAAFFIRQMAMLKALQDLFNSPQLPILLPMSEPEDPGEGVPV